MTYFDRSRFGHKICRCVQLIEPINLFSICQLNEQITAIEFHELMALLRNTYKSFEECYGNQERFSQLNNQIFNGQSFLFVSDFFRCLISAHPPRLIYSQSFHSQLVISVSFVFCSLMPLVQTEQILWQSTCSKKCNLPYRVR